MAVSCAQFDLPVNAPRALPDLSARTAHVRGGERVDRRPEYFS